MPHIEKPSYVTHGRIDGTIHDQIYDAIDDPLMGKKAPIPIATP